MYEVQVIARGPEGLRNNLSFRTNKKCLDAVIAMVKDKIASGEIVQPDETKAAAPDESK